MLKTFFVFEIFTILSRLFSHVEKNLDMEVKVNCKLYDVSCWTSNNYNTQYINN